MEINIKNKTLSDGVINKFIDTVNINNLNNYQQREEFRFRNKLKKPISTINKIPVTLGSVVYLKNQENISSIYDSRLKSLIDSSHRFAIMDKLDINDFKRLLPPSDIIKKDNTIPICLLSTSKYLNEDKQLGIKLNGDYSKFGNGKSVYMDITNIFIIKPSCIKEVSYHLSPLDSKSLEIINLVGVSNFKIYKGLIGDYTVDINMPKYNEANRISGKLFEGNNLNILNKDKRDALIKMFLNCNIDIKQELLEKAFGVLKLHNLIINQQKNYNMCKEDTYNLVYTKYIERLNDSEIELMYQSLARNYIYKGGYI